MQENIAEGIVKYKERVTYFFDPERSEGLSENDELTILNIPYVVCSSGFMTILRFNVQS